MPRNQASKRPQPRTESVLPPPLVPPRGSEVTAEKLLQATHELLCESAGAEPTVNQISDRVGVRVAMVSYCFGGKAQLLDALVDRAVGGIMAEQEALMARRLPAHETLAIQVEATVRNLVRFPYLNSLSSRLAAGDSSIARMSETFVGPTIAAYRLLIDEGVRQGTLRPVDPTLLLFSIVGMSDFLFGARNWLTDTGQQLDDALIERFVQHTVSMALHGVATDDAEPA